jgi:hypothetical protein
MSNKLRLYLTPPRIIPEQVTTIKSISKVVTKGTKHIGKTLTAMSDSPDKHRQGLINKMQNPQHQRDGRREKVKQTKVVVNGAMGMDTGKSWSCLPRLWLCLEAKSPFIFLQVLVGQKQLTEKFTLLRLSRTLPLMLPLRQPL